MATNLNYNLTLNTRTGVKNITDLYNYGKTVFAKGYDVKLGSKGGLGGVGGDLKDFGRTLDSATDRIVAFSATTSLIYATGRALQRLVTDAIAVESAITGIQSILNATNVDLEKFTGSLFELANKSGVGFLDAAKAAEEFARQGLSLEKTLSATAAALGIFRVSGGNITKIIEGLTSSVNSFADEGIGFQEVADKLAALDAQFATSATGLIEGLKRVGATAQDAGIAFDELGALIASVRQISGRSEAVIGNGLKTIVTNLQNAGIQERIEAIGVAVRDAGGEFRPVIDVIRDLSTAFKGLTDAQQAELGTKIAGKFQINTFKSLLQATRQGGFYESGLEVSQNANGDIAKRLEILNQTTATAIQQFENNFTRLGSTLGDSVGKEFVNSLVEYGNIAISGLADLFTKGNPIGGAISAGLNSAITGPGFLLLGSAVVQLGKRISTGLIQGLKSIGNLNSATQEQLSLQKQINAALLQGNSIIQKRTAGANPISLATYRKNQREKAGAQNVQNFLQSPNKFFGAERNVREQASRYGVSTQSSAFIQKQREARESRSSRAIGAGLGVSFLGAAAASVIPDSEARKIVEAGTTALGTALVGASFGPLGAAVGAVIGGFGLLTTVTDNLYGNLEEANNKARNNIAVNEKQAAAGEEYIQALEKLQRATENGTAAQRIAAREEVSRIGSSLQGRQKDLLTARTPEERVQVLERSRAETNTLNAGSLAIAAAEKIYTETFASLSSKVNDLLGQDAPRLSSGGIENSRNLAKNIVDTIDLTKVNLDSLNKQLSSFTQTGDSTSLQQTVQGLITNSGAEEAFQKIATNFKDGSSALSLYIASTLAQVKTNERLAKVQQNLIQQSAGLDKAFRDVFTKAAREGSRRDTRSLSALDQQITELELSGSRLEGPQAIEFDSQTDKLRLESEALAKRFEALGKYTPQVLTAITEGSQGAEARGAALESVQKFIEGSISALDLQPTLTKLVGGDKAKSIFQQLESASLDLSYSFEEINDNLDNQLNKSVLKTNQAFKNLRLDKLTELFGDITQDPKDSTDVIRSGAAARRRRENLVTDTNSDSNIALIRGFQEERKLGLISDKELLNRIPELSAAIRDLSETRRQEVGLPQLQDILKNIEGFSQEQVVALEKSFKTGDFIGAREIVDKNPFVSNSRRDELSKFFANQEIIRDNLPDASQEKLKVITGVSENEKLLKSSQDANKILESINANTAARAGDSLALDGLIKRFQIEDNQKQIQTQIADLTDKRIVEQKNLDSAVFNRRNFEQALDVFKPKSEEEGQRQLESFRNRDNASRENDPYGVLNGNKIEVPKVILAKEAEFLKEFARTRPTDADTGLNKLLESQFGQKRANEIIQTGVLDSLRGTQDPNKFLETTKVIDDQLSEQQKRLTELEKQKTEVLKQTKADVDKSNIFLEKIAENTSGGIGSVVAGGNNINRFRDQEEKTRILQSAAAEPIVSKLAISVEDKRKIESTLDKLTPTDPSKIEKSRQQLSTNRIDDNGRLVPKPQIVLPEESSFIKDILNKEGGILGEQFNKALEDRFGEKRTREIIQTGVLDPVIKVEPKQVLDTKKLENIAKNTARPEAAIQTSNDNSLNKFKDQASVTKIIESVDAPKETTPNIGDIVRRIDKITLTAEDSQVEPSKIQPEENKFIKELLNKEGSILGAEFNKALESRFGEERAQELTETGIVDKQVDFNKPFAPDKSEFFKKLDELTVVNKNPIPQTQFLKPDEGKFIKELLAKEGGFQGEQFNKALKDKFGTERTREILNTNVFDSVSQKTDTSSTLNNRIETQLNKFRQNPPRLEAADKIIPEKKKAEIIQRVDKLTVVGSGKDQVGPTKLLQDESSFIKEILNTKGGISEREFKEVINSTFGEKKSQLIETGIISNDKENTVANTFEKILNNVKTKQLSGLRSPKSIGDSPIKVELDASRPVPSSVKEFSETKKTSIDKIISQTNDKLLTKVSEKILSKENNRVTDKTNDKLTAEIDERTIEKINDSVTNKFSDRSIAKNTDNFVSRVSDQTRSTSSSDEKTSTKEIQSKKIEINDTNLNEILSRDSVRKEFSSQRGEMNETSVIKKMQETVLETNRPLKAKESSIDKIVSKIESKDRLSSQSSENNTNTVSKLIRQEELSVVKELIKKLPVDTTTKNHTLQQLDKSRNVGIIPIESTERLDILSPRQPKREVEETQDRVREKETEINRIKNKPSEAQNKNIQSKTDDKTAVAIDSLVSALEKGITTNISTSVTADVNIKGSVVADYQSDEFKNFFNAGVRQLFIEFSKQQGQNPAIIPA